MSDSPDSRLSGTPEPPFRWDVSKREQVAGLLTGWVPGIPAIYAAELVACCARVVALCGDGDLFFVGRSPDNLFDVLSGILADTSWEQRIRQLPLSLKWDEDVSGRSETRRALRRYLESLELSPEQINGRHRPTVLVDIVSVGRTYGELVRTWHEWAGERRTPWAQVRRKLRLIGITQATKTSPKTWRWQQHAPWAALLPARSIKNVSVSWPFWKVLSDHPKATRTFPPGVWSAPDMARPSRRPENIEGLREAVYWYETGRARFVREHFAGQLMRTRGVRSPWLRTLAHEIRAHRGDDEGFEPVPDDAPHTLVVYFGRMLKRRAEQAAAAAAAVSVEGAATSDEPTVPHA